MTKGLNTTGQFRVLPSYGETAKYGLQATSSLQRSNQNCKRDTQNAL